MASFEELRAVRLQKLEYLKEHGVNPYPIEARFDYTLSEIAGRFEEIEKKAGLRKEQISLVGRVLALRPQGGLIFFHIFDGNGKFQGLLRKEDVSEEIFSLFEKTVDIGDFIE